MKFLKLSILLLAIGLGFYFYGNEEGIKEIKEKVNSVVSKNNDVVKKTKPVVKGPEIVKGYLLPPEPDKALNDSTLLGIDANDNMLRDDVERWIVKQNWSPNRIAASLQFARGLEIILRDDMGSNKRRFALWEMASSVLTNIKQKEEGRIVLMEDEIDLFEKKIFNTKERHREYMKFDRSFSGQAVHAFPDVSDMGYKYADYKMENGKLDSYEFTGRERYYSNDLIPLYGKDGLIGSYWNLEKNDIQEFEGDWNDKFCEINFGISKNGPDCWEQKKEYRKNLKKD